VDDSYRIRFWEFQPKAKTPSPSKPTEFLSVESLQYSSDGSRVALVGPNNKVSVFTTKAEIQAIAPQFADCKGKLVSFVLGKQTNLALFSDGNLQVGQSDRFAIPSPVKSLNVTSACFLGSTTKCLLGTSDGKLHIAALDPPAVEQTIQGHSDPIITMAVPDGQRVFFTASKDGEVVIWDRVLFIKRSSFQLPPAHGFDFIFDQPTEALAVVSWSLDNGVMKNSRIYRLVGDSPVRPKRTFPLPNSP
jgi:WD40 repeat protein